MDRFTPRRGTPNPSWSAYIYMQDAALKAMQSAFGDYLALSPSFFISGCTITQEAFGTATSISITAGMAMFNGEPVPVVAGSVLKPASQVAFLKLVDAPEDIAPLLNVDGQTDYVRRKRTAVLVTGVDYPDPFMSLDSPTKAELDVLRFRGRMVPKGSIVPYYGTMSLFDITGLGQNDTAMEGWAVCNGLNGTVDMRGLVPLGATGVPSSGAADVSANVVGASNPGDIAGADEVSIEADNLPAHTHPYVDDIRETSATGSGVQTGSGLQLNANPQNKTTSANVTDHDALSVKQASRSLVFIQSIV